MNRSRTAILHYAAPPVVGGVEAVIEAHARLLTGGTPHGDDGHAVAVIAGRGEQDPLPVGAEFHRIPKIDSQHPEIAAVTAKLREGQVPPAFEELAEELREALAAALSGFDHVIVHNVFTKRFNLPLTAALFRLLDEGEMPPCIAWCHDIGWTSAHSRPNLHQGYPWDLLRTRRQDVTYVVVSEERRRSLAELFDCGVEEITVIHNGVDPAQLLGLTEEGGRLIEGLGLLESDLILLMPVRVTEAKNIELALRVVAALKGRGRAVKLVLTGPPDPHDEESMTYFRALQALRRELGVEEELRFVFESGPEPDQPYTIDMPVVADLLRVSDVMFMPSHREGFGMPVLEAGLIGIPVFCTRVPAAEEIGGREVDLMRPDEDAGEIADRILSRVAERAVHRLRRRIRQRYTWSAIFGREIEPLLQQSRAR